MVQTVLKTLLKQHVIAIRCSHQVNDSKITNDHLHASSNTGNNLITAPQIYTYKILYRYSKSMKCHKTKEVMVTKLPWLYDVSRAKETLVSEDLKRNAIMVSFSQILESRGLSVYMQACNKIKIKTFQAEISEEVSRNQTIRHTTKQGSKSNHTNSPHESEEYMKNLDQ